MASYLEGLASVDFGGLSGGENAAANVGAAVGAAPVGVSSSPTLARGLGGLGAAAQRTGIASAGLQAPSNTLAGRGAPVDVQPFSVAASWAEALKLYLDTLTQPPQWNAWQSVAYNLVRLYEEDFDHMNRNEIAGLISSKYHELMPRVYGSSWRALRSQVPGAWRFTGSPPPAVGRERSEGARDVVHLSPPNLSRSISPQAVTLPETIPINSSDGTARAMSLGVQYQSTDLLGLNSRDNELVYQAPHAWESDVGSETSSVYRDRVGRLGQHLVAQDFPPDLSAFVVAVEEQKRFIHGMWKQLREQSEMNGVVYPTLAAWCCQQIDQRSYYRLQNTTARQAQYQAFASLAGLPSETVQVGMREIVDRDAGSPASGDRQSSSLPTGVSGPQSYGVPGAYPASPVHQFMGGNWPSWNASGSGLDQQFRMSNPGSVPGAFEGDGGTAYNLMGSTSTPMAPSVGAMDRCLQAQTDASKNLSSAMAKLTEQLDKGGDSKSRDDDKCNAIIGLKFDQQLPVLKDSDVNFEDHWLSFTSIMEMHSFGRKGVRPMDRLVAFGTSLAKGGTRHRLYTTAWKQAQRDKRFPEQAAAVLLEIYTKLSGSLRETDFQKKTRLDREFEALDMRGRTHAEFRSMFEEKLFDMDCAGIKPDEGVLFRKYITKITAELRSSVMQRDWKLDEGSDVQRNPVKWEEVAKAIDILLESRCDAKAPTDQVNLLQQSLSTTGLAVCNACHKPGHQANVCPSKYVQARNEGKGFQELHEKDGSKCNLCGGTDHRARHHALASDARRDGPKIGGEGGGKSNFDHQPIHTAPVAAVVPRVMVSRKAKAKAVRLTKYTLLPAEVARPPGAEANLCVGNAKNLRVRTRKVDFARANAVCATSLNLPMTEVNIARLMLSLLRRTAKAKARERLRVASRAPSLRRRLKPKRRRVAAAVSRRHPKARTRRLTALRKAIPCVA